VRPGMVNRSHRENKYLTNSQKQGEDTAVLHAHWVSESPKKEKKRRTWTEIDHQANVIKSRDHNTARNEEKLTADCDKKRVPSRRQLSDVNRQKLLCDLQARGENDRCSIDKKRAQNIPNMVW